VLSLCDFKNHPPKDDFERERKELLEKLFSSRKAKSTSLTVRINVSRNITGRILKDIAKSDTIMANQKGGLYMYKVGLSSCAFSLRDKRASSPRPQAHFTGAFTKGKRSESARKP